MKVETSGSDTGGATRREFLQRSGLAVAGAVLIPNLFISGRSRAQGGVMSESSTKKIRMGIVGGGFGCAFHWHLDPNCIVEAVSDLRADRRKALQDVYRCDKAYNSLEELIKDPKVDAVAVFTGPPDHARHTIACMKAGKHVISAVPACVSIEEAEHMLEVAKKTGLTYMMAETSYYRPVMISARQFLKEGKFGDIYYTEAEYHHHHDAGTIKGLWFGPNGERTWRWAFPPMLYPTHATAYLIGLTDERLVEVTCYGWGDDDPAIKGNTYKNPFWNETALFKTNKGNSFRVSVNWKGAFGSCERGQWYGSKMSLFDYSANGMGPIIRRSSGTTEADAAGFAMGGAEREEYQPPDYAQSMLPEPMRVGGGHGGSEPMLTHEFIDALVHNRKPAVDIYSALAMTVPGIVAHNSALRGGRQMKVPNFG